MRALRWMAVLGLWVLGGVLGGAACDKAPETVGSARLPEAEAVVEAPAGAAIEVGKTPVPKSVSGVVRLAADSEVPYSDVLAAAHAVTAAGGKPVLLVVTRRGKLSALPEPLPPAPTESIKLSARIDGKACVSPPDTEEATCISRMDQKRIDRAFVRQILYKAVKEYNLTRIRVVVDPGLPWADVVRAIDGARTCCSAEDKITVSVEPT